ncbi:hypothetical protein [Mycoplasmoides pirum]|uniref:hypothetical protein n=1 Tax=Mycoplasmoides pirum TaxID=2122 RepID=UPI00055D3CB9|nr:hypothetical protein [Mycoplasmoides pirum]
MDNKKENNTIFIKTTNDENVKEILVEKIDNNKYQNIKTSDKFNWFYAICSIFLMIIGIFVGISLCCLCILYA